MPTYYFSKIEPNMNGIIHVPSDLTLEYINTGR